MRKIGTILLVLLALALAGIMLLPKLVPMETVAAKVKEQVRKATGRDMDFKGATLVFWPNIGVEMTDVTLSNPAWAKEKNMLTLGKVDVALAVKPLLQKQIEVKHFVLDHLVLHLEVAENGKKSWDFTPEKQASAEHEDVASSAAGLPAGFNFKFGESKIRNSKLTFTDHQKGGSSVVDDIDMTLNFPDLRSALQLKGALIYKKKRVELAVDLVKPVEFLEGNPSPGHLNLKTEDISVKSAGALATQGELFNGNVDVDIASLAKLLAWSGDGKEKKLPFEKVSFSSTLRASKTDLVLKTAELTLDEVKAKGNMNIGFANKPDIFARLSLNKLNLDRFTGAKDKVSGDSAAAPAKADAGWDAAPIDLSGLKAVNTDLELKTEGFSVSGVDVGPSVLSVQLQDGKLHFKSSEASLFSGKFSSDLTVNAAASPAAMAFNFDTSGVQAKPVLETFANFKKLSGTANADIAVTSSGNSQKALISNLGGHGSVVFRNGSLEGIDLLNIAKLVQKRLADMKVGEGKTDFVELGGTFTITNGIVSNNDLKMKGPLLQASGKGLIDLPGKYIQYRVTPVLTASSAVEGAAGIAVPVDIRGPFSGIRIKPDFASVVQNAIAHPEQAKQVLKDAKGQLRDVRGQLKDLKKDPVQTLQNLFGGGGLFPVPAKAPVPPPETPAAPPAAEPAPQTVP